MEINLIQLAIETELYMISVSYTILDNKGKTHQYSVTAIIDTGSPVSLMKPDYAPVSFCIPIAKDSYKYYGVTGRDTRHFRKNC